VKPGLCWLKNMYFRVDEEFYAELDAKLEVVRKKEVRWLGTPNSSDAAPASSSTITPR